MTTIDIKDQVACIKRELSFREHVYPKWVAAGRMTKEKADLELARMRAVLATLQKLEPSTGDLFQE